MSTQIRHSEPTDIEAIKNIYAEKPNYSGTLQLPYPSLHRWQQFLGNPPTHFHSLVAERDGLIVGQLGLEVLTTVRRKHVGNLGMAVLSAFQGQGIGKALIKEAIHMADQWLNLHRLELEVYTDNPGAIHLYQSVGFVTEGRCQDYAFRDGRYVDVLLMARLNGSKQSDTPDA